MKLFRHGPLGHERAGAVDRDGALRDLSLLVADVTPEWLAPDKLAALAAIDLAQLPRVADGARLGVPVAGVRQFVAIGLNYRRHAAESGIDLPAEPIVFNKALGALAGPNDDVVHPAGCAAVDYEIELGVVVGSRARDVDVADALRHVAGYCLANDLSERDWQMKRSGQWVKGKSFDGFGPIGPWLVTADEVADPQSLPLALDVNGEPRQRSSTADMVFGVAEIVAHLSRFMTLLPGDVIVTGTPEGVGYGMKPPRYLQRGDVVTLDGGVLGTQRQRIV